MKEGLAGFDEDIADEAIAYDDVDISFEDVEAFDEAVIVDEVSESF